MADHRSMMHRHRHHLLNLRNAVIVIVLAVLFAGIAILAFSANGAIAVNGSQSYIIGKGSTLGFYINGGKTFSIYLGNSSAGYAEFYVSPYPILASPITEIGGAPGADYNLSVSGTGTADINFKIISSNATASKVQITPLPSGLSIQSSSLATVVVPAPLPTGGSSVLQGTTTVASTSTTTISPSATSTISGAQGTTTQSTTTIQQQVPQSIIELVNTTSIGMLMDKLGVLYAEEPQCTESLYNQTYITEFHTSPEGPLDYVNATKSTPSSEAMTIKQLPSGLYLVNYSVTAKLKSFSGTVISMDMDSSGDVSNVNFIGLFSGLNYTTLSNAYNTQAAVGNGCAAYVQ
ncbi:MAG: hypothetical protein M1156_01940 [Candidatus Marsarchaeota archaeon]|jgi:hypothetical protein|nr:hypothetical protein [Candidatus Marsarchaeota archaeon]